MNKLIFVLSMLCCVGCEDGPDKRPINAAEHAKALGLKNPLISCDPDTCQCTISWETCFIADNNYHCGREVATYNCCGKGCSVPN